MRFGICSLGAYCKFLIGPDEALRAESRWPTFILCLSSLTLSAAENGVVCALIKQQAVKALHAPSLHLSQSMRALGLCLCVVLSLSHLCIGLSPDGCHTTLRQPHLHFSTVYRRLSITFRCLRISHYSHAFGDGHWVADIDSGPFGNFEIFGQSRVFVHLGPKTQNSVRVVRDS